MTKHGYQYHDDSFSRSSIPLKLVKYGLHPVFHYRLSPRILLPHRNTLRPPPCNCRLPGSVTLRRRRRRFSLGLQLCSFRFLPSFRQQL